MDKRADGFSCYETNSTILSCRGFFSLILFFFLFHFIHLFSTNMSRRVHNSLLPHILSPLYPQSNVARSNRCTLSASRVCSIAPKHTNEKEPKEEDEEYLKVLNCVQRFHDIYISFQYASLFEQIAPELLCLLLACRVPPAHYEARLCLLVLRFVPRPGKKKVIKKHFIYR